MRSSATSVRGSVPPDSDFISMVGAESAGLCTKHLSRFIRGLCRSRRSPGGFRNRIRFDIPGESATQGKGQRVGAVRGEVRGANKGECAERLQQLLDKDFEGWSVSPGTRSKRELKTLMKQDPETGEWVLSYRAHT